MATNEPRLAARNPEVQIACKHPQTAQLISERGVRVFGLGGETRTRLKAVAAIEELEGPLDLVFLATKANDAVGAAQRVEPLLTPESWVVSLQNGVAEDDLAEVLGADRVVGCVVGWGATHYAPAELEATSPGEFVIGAWGRPQPERLAGLQEVMPTRMADNIRGELYSKLIVNACINSLGAFTGQRLGASDFLEKPVQMAELLQAVDRARERYNKTT